MLLLSMSLAPAPLQAQCGALQSAPTIAGRATCPMLPSGLSCLLAPAMIRLNLQSSEQKEDGGRNGITTPICGDTEDIICEMMDAVTWKGVYMHKSNKESRSLHVGTQTSSVIAVAIRHVAVGNGRI